MLKISFIAPGCYGKSTAIDILLKHYNLKNIKISDPLYELQSMFYKYINKDIDNKKDGELLQYFGNKIREQKPTFLLDVFTEKINRAASFDLITNDDCRPPDYDYLKKLGFKFILINGFSRNRIDHTTRDSKYYLEWTDQSIEIDFTVDNLGTLEEFEQNLIDLIKKIQQQ